MAADREPGPDRARPLRGHPGAGPLHPRRAPRGPLARDVRGPVRRRGRLGRRAGDRRRGAGGPLPRVGRPAGGARPARPDLGAVHPRRAHPGRHARPAAGARRPGDARVGVERGPGRGLQRHGRPRGRAAPGGGRDPARDPGHRRRRAVELRGRHPRRQAAARPGGGPGAVPRRGAAPGRERPGELRVQLAAVRGAVASAADPELLRRWLAGDVPAPGVEVDLDLRWRILVRLATLGAVGRTELDAAFDAEPSAKAAVDRVRRWPRCPTRRRRSSPGATSPGTRRPPTTRSRRPGRACGGAVRRS